MGESQLLPTQDRSLSYPDFTLYQIARFFIVAALLEIDALTPVLVSENVTYAAEATPVDVARIHYRGDRFTFAISLDIP